MQSLVRLQSGDASRTPCGQHGAHSSIGFPPSSANAELRPAPACVPRAWKRREEFEQKLTKEAKEVRAGNAVLGNGFRTPARYLNFANFVNFCSKASLASVDQSCPHWGRATCSQKACRHRRQQREFEQKETEQHSRNHRRSKRNRE